MLFALGDPLQLAILVAAAVVAVVLCGAVQAAVAARLGDRAAQAAGRTGLDPRRHVDPFGAVGAVIGGVGWPRPVPVDPRRLGSTGRLAAVLLSGPAVLVVLGLALLAAASPLVASLERLSPAAALLGQVSADPTVALLVLPGCVFLSSGLLAFLPLPPLPGGRLLFAMGRRRTPGWQRAEHLLDEQNVGVAVLLALLVLRLSGSVPLLLSLLDLVARPLVALVG